MSNLHLCRLALCLAILLCPALAQPNDSAEAAHLQRQRQLLLDWASLTRYGSEDSRDPAAQGRRKSGRISRRPDNGRLGRGGNGEFFPGKTLLEPRHPRPIDRADAGSLPPGCDRATTKGRRDPGGHERSGRAYGSGDGRHDARELHVHDGTCEGAWHPRGARVRIAGLRLLQEPDALYGLRGRLSP